ncbi:cytosolic phospholipase A2 beta-like [Sceloporus undulatus]|uniref:cytosolic phospholipase A2 beta-like n=1 Tax=Sceloporus undulatus TaxID=8520 RepID=UPI001C4C07B7|nr:cytosolic phospholipase A2 beta-like [Sceloporus undulatus]
MATGGGLRAMTALYAHLLAFQKLNLLDCISYISTASGSTWTLTDLYKNADWSYKSLEEPIKRVKKQMMKNKVNIISIEQLKYYHKELVERVEMGHLSSFTSLWALVQEAVLHDEPNDCKLSEQRQALAQGQNPFPIYTAINVKDRHVSTFDFREWVEFNPYEVGFQKYGAYIRAEDFDSEFFMGKVVKKIPESRICYLEGIWTNIFSRNLLDGLYWSSTPAEFWERWIKDMADKRMSTADKPSGAGNCHLASLQPFGESLEKLLLYIKNDQNNSDDGYTTYKPPSCATGKLSEIFNDVLTDRPLKGATHNFLRSLDFDKDYLQQKEFNEWRDTVLDASPSRLTPCEKSLCLIDIGYFINNSGPPLLKPERNVDVIIALDYELGVPFKQAEMMAKYCEVQGIPFPKVDVSDEDRKNPKECYVFSDENNPKAPELVCFPLVDCSFKEYKAPGTKRSPSEMSDGEVNLEKGCSPYATIHLTYAEEDCDKLLNLSTYNILCNKHHIFKAILGAIEKRQNIWPSS